MALPKRESPKGKRESLFITCMIDMHNPNTGISVAKVLERLNIEVDILAEGIKTGTNVKD